MPQPDEKPVKIDEVADRLGVSTQTIGRWAKNNGLPAFRPGGHGRGSVFYFYLSEVKEWWEKQRV